MRSVPRLLRNAWPLSAWSALTLAAGGYGAYILWKAPLFLDEPGLLEIHSIGLAASSYAFATGVFGLLYLRRELEARIPAALRLARAWRGVLYAILGSLVLGLSVSDDPDVSTAIFRTGLAAANLGLLLSLSLAPRLERLGRSAWIRRTDLVLGNLALTALALEATFRIYAAFTASPLFLRYESGNKIERALRPGQVRMGFRTNDRGFYDEPFAVEKPAGTCRIVALGDSFAAGIVPYPYNSLTLLEDALDAPGARPEGIERIEVYNLGVNGIDAGDYRYLLLTEGIRYEPDLVVVLFYLGNDFGGTSLPGVLDRNFWYLYFVPHRLLTLGREASRRDVSLWEVGAEKESDWEDPAYLSDPSLEEPSFSVETYMQIERNWLGHFRKNGASRRREDRTLAALEDIFRTARARPGGRVALVLVPAEFQVDDDHYREVLEYHRLRAEHFDLAEPGQRLAEFCRDRDVPCLDLTGPLREAHRSGRVYHLRDMHWNARGNRAAAEAMAPFLLEVLREGRGR